MEAEQEHNPMSTQHTLSTQLLLHFPGQASIIDAKPPFPSIPFGKYQSVLGPGCLLAPARLLRTRAGKSALGPKPSFLQRACPLSRRGFPGREAGGTQKGREQVPLPGVCEQCPSRGCTDLPHCGIRLNPTSLEVARHHPPCSTSISGSTKAQSHTHPGKAIGQGG